MVEGPIATSWLGVYSYDNSDSYPEAYVDTDFEMQLRLGWFGRFRGTVLDAEPGIQEPTSILGNGNRWDLPASNGTWTATPLSES